MTPSCSTFCPITTATIRLPASTPPSWLLQRQLATSPEGNDMRMKSLVQDARETQLAMEMIELGARMQMLESETGLSRERLLKLYKEIRQESPPKGMLP